MREPWGFIDIVFWICEYDAKGELVRKIAYAGQADPDNPRAHKDAYQIARVDLQRYRKHNFHKRVDLAWEFVEV